MAVVRHLEFSKFCILVMWPVCNLILLLRAKFCVNRTINRWHYTQKRFSIWRPAAILGLQNFDILGCGCYWNQNLHRHTKLRWNRMILCWDIAIKPFSKWRPSAMLNFRNMVFWSRELYLNMIVPLLTEFRVNRATKHRDRPSQKRFSIWQPSAILDLLWRHHTSFGTLYYVPNIALNFRLDWFSTFWYTWRFVFHHFGWKLPIQGQIF